VEEACPGYVGDRRAYLASGMDHIHSEGIHCISAKKEHNKTKLSELKNMPLTVKMHMF